MSRSVAFVHSRQLISEKKAFKTGGALPAEHQTAESALQLKSPEMSFRSGSRLKNSDKRGENIGNEAQLNYYSYTLIDQRTAEHIAVRSTPVHYSSKLRK